MRPRDPRSALSRRRRAAARVRIMDVAASDAKPGGAVTTEQAAEVTLPREELDRIWSPEYLERLARTYWRFLSRASLGVLRVLYTESSREIVLLRRPLVLLRFRKPEYEYDATRGTVTWPIDRGLLVAPSGRGKGFLRISVRRPPPGETEGQREITAQVNSEVASFYPTIAGWGWFARHVYRITQLKIHVIVTNAFLRSLARLDLAPSKVGALVGEGVAQAEEPEAALEGTRRS
jgi:hypothetical protein